MFAISPPPIPPAVRAIRVSNYFDSTALPAEPDGVWRTIHHHVDLERVAARRSVRFRGDRSRFNNGKAELVGHAGIYHCLTLIDLSFRTREGSR